MVPVVALALVEEHGAVVVEAFLVAIWVVAVVETDWGPTRKRLVEAEADLEVVLGMRDVAVVESQFVVVEGVLVVVEKC